MVERGRRAGHVTAGGSGVKEQPVRIFFTAPAVQAPEAAVLVLADLDDLVAVGADIVLIGADPSAVAQKRAVVLEPLFGEPIGIPNSRSSS